MVDHVKWVNAMLFQPTTLKRFPADYPKELHGEINTLVWDDPRNNHRIPCISVGRVDAPRHIIFFHGNAETLAGDQHAEPPIPGARITALKLAEACDARVHVPEYPGYWVSDDNERMRTTEEVMYDAAVTVSTILLSLYETQDIAVIGFSLGTSLAVRVARTKGLRERIKCIVLFAPFYGAFDVIIEKLPMVWRWTLGAVKPGLDLFRTYADAPYVSAPCLVIHGENDITISHTQGHRIADALHANFKMVGGNVSHNDLLQSGEALTVASRHVLTYTSGGDE